MVTVTGNEKERVEAAERTEPGEGANLGEGSSDSGKEKSKEPRIMLSKHC